MRMLRCRDSGAGGEEMAELHVQRVVQVLLQPCSRWLRRDAHHDLANLRVAITHFAIFPHRTTVAHERCVHMTRDSRRTSRSQMVRIGEHLPVSCDGNWSRSMQTRSAMS